MAGEPWPEQGIAAGGAVPCLSLPNCPVLCRAAVPRGTICSRPRPCTWQGGDNWGAGGDAPWFLPLPNHSMAACGYGGDAKSKCFDEVERWGHSGLCVAVMGQNFGVFWGILMSFCALEMGFPAACCGCEG